MAGASPAPNPQPTPNLANLGLAPTPATPTAQDRQSAFLNAEADRKTVAPDRVQAPASPNILQAGVVIPAAMIPASAPISDEGDFYLLTDGRPYCFASDPSAPVRDGARTIAEHLCEDGIVRFGTGGSRTVGAGGRFLFDEEMGGWLLELLPPLIVIRRYTPQARALCPALDLIRLETEAIMPGASTVAGSLASIVLVNILRAYLATEAPPVGWLGALADPQIGKALRLMHADVARRWRVEDLASAVAMSRTSFSEHFRRHVGMPPLEYFTRWRMALARHALKSSDAILATVATMIGYESETAFSLRVQEVVRGEPRALPDTCSHHVGAGQCRPGRR